MCWPCASARRWTFPNNDKVFHNVFSFRDGKKFDLGMYPKGVTKPIVFDKPGLARLFCNIHPNMAAYVMAVDSPYFAVTDENGAFTIAGVPPGTYTYHAWRPGGQALTGSITVDGDELSKSIGHNPSRPARSRSSLRAAAPALAQEQRLRQSSI